MGQQYLLHEDGHQELTQACQHVCGVSGGAEVLSDSGIQVDGAGDCLKSKENSSHPPLALNSISREPPPHLVAESASRWSRAFDASQALPCFALFPWLHNLARGGGIMIPF